jgi:hemoglobin
MPSEPTLYEVAGGMPFFESLVNRFYDAVASDPELLRVYPEPADLAAARHNLTLFLAQYWGGPRTYDGERGHPRLRMRHAPFAIGPGERDRWLGHMRAAIAELQPPPEVAVRLDSYFEMAAEAMRNRE